MEEPTPNFKSRLAAFARTGWKHAGLLAGRIGRVVIAVGRFEPLRASSRVAGRGLRVGLIASCISASLFLLGWMTLIRVPPGVIGVKQVLTGSGQGIVARDHDAGLYFSLRGYHAWHFVDRQTQILSFVWSPDHPDERPVLGVRTKDGNQATVLAAVPYRIIEGRGHRIVSEGLKGAWKRRVHATTEKVLLRELAQLSSDQFIDTDLRLANLEGCLRELNILLERFHVRAESIQIHGVYFSPEYEKKLQQKQLTRQESLQSTVANEVLEQNREIKLLEEEIEREERLEVARMDKQIDGMRVESETRIATLLSAAEAYKQRRKVEAQAVYDGVISEGGLLLAEAEAERERLIQSAYAGPSGRVWLATKAASNLRIKKVVLDSSNPDTPSLLDLDGMVRTLLGDG